MSPHAGDPPSARALRIFWSLGVLACGALAGCAVLEPLYPGADLPLVDSGRTLALGECSACHAVGPSGGAPATGAPSFSSIAERYRDYRLDWELETISQVGHYRMPAKMLTSPEIAALTAYIRTLDSAKPSNTPAPGIR
ncbi:cytochrome C [Caulobacter sp. Root656]|nr:cytochrome C [Caulobacter sp. Root656]